MEKKILIAVDDSIHSRNIINYVLMISSAVKNLFFTLYNVQPAISQFLLDEARTDLSRQNDLKSLCQKNEENSMILMDKCKNLLVDSKVDTNRIKCITQPRRLGIAKDIIDHAQQGNYDAIVVGRRGISRLQETFAGSITSNLLENSRVIPVWMVNGHVTSNKIMIAIDGSESSLRAVDHLCFMTSGNPDLVIKLLHVVPRFGDFCPIETESPRDNIEKILIQGDKRCIDNFYPIAMQRFKESGFAESQVQLKIVEYMFNPGKAIVEEAKAENYGTIVVGRRGVSNAFFMGSVSRCVINKSDTCALWLVS